MMKPTKRSTLNSSYNPVTRMYENAVGKFLTYAEARQKQRRCEKCSEMFANYRLLRDHKKEFHSY
jgi:hypothetical protein